MTTEQSPLSDMPASEEAAMWAYRLILGREPENPEVVRDHARCSASVAELRERFVGSSEFTQRYRAVVQDRERNVSVFPPCPIQTQVDEATRIRLLDHIARAWEHLGETEPYWSVMSQPQYAMESIGESRAAFLDSGRENVERLMATLRRNGVQPDPHWEVMELGCGLGRSTRWLAPLFHKVHAVDVSSSHLRLARQINADAPYFERIEWIRLQGLQAAAALPSFDLFFSMIVLQHNPPPIIGMLLEAVAEKLRPGGIAFFQVPTYQRGYSFDAESYLRLRADTREIEMHAFPQSEVFRIFREHGCVPLEVFEDGLSGHRDNHRSNSFLFRKISSEDFE
ncbi:MAG TPA: class I SAM-dependent methyltransferase [Rhodanobacteraceae bacterium]|jgi:SAM-dependent methyltransferase|nr:class I SAM-dependent methyltransferase [Rhodanobacteraceae bacterium]